MNAKQKNFYARSGFVCSRFVFSLLYVNRKKTFEMNFFLFLQKSEERKKVLAVEKNFGGKAKIRKQETKSL